MVIAFATFFLGLTVGLHPVELDVAPGVVRVELHLDGELAHTLEGAPWGTELDFGDELRPRHLEALAFDAEGAEVSRIEQWVNLPHPPAAITVALDEHVPGKPRNALIRWETTTGNDPKSIRVSFDGKPLRFKGQGVQLPPHDLSSLHFLRVELDFGGGVEPVKELAFGGTYGDQVSTELTALPILVEKGQEAPTVESLQGLLTARGETLRVTAVEQGESNVVLLTNRPYRAPFEPQGMTLRHYARLPKDMTVNVLTTAPTRFEGVRASFMRFPMTRKLSREDGGLYFLASRLRADPVQKKKQRLGEAVAVAGLNAFQGGNRRAVVMILSRDLPDYELHPAYARRYLEHLHIPLHIWVPDTKPHPDHEVWGEARSISTIQLFKEAAEDLFESMEQQWIVWLDGNHLPQEIELAPNADGLSLVGPSS